MYRSEDFASVPRSRRDAAVALRVPVWSPFERSGHHCVWSGATAMVWFWDEDAVQVHPASLGWPETGTADAAGTGSRVHVLPETVFQPRHEDGLGVQECQAGFDLQFWRRGVLEDSLWLPRLPDDSRIESFLSHETLAGQDVPAPAHSPVAFAPDPWLSPLAPRAWLIANERTLVLAGLVVFAAVAAFQEARYWRYHFARDAAVHQLDRIEAEIGPILDTRNELEALDRRNAFLAGIVRQPSQARLMTEVNHALPRGSIQFESWRYQQGQLTVTLSDRADVDTIEVIRNLQAVALFDAVQPGRSRTEGTEVKLRLDLERSNP